nr:unnamed protein product [Spirometra erinaceieuropaei]
MASTAYPAGWARRRRRVQHRPLPASLQWAREQRLTRLLVSSTRATRTIRVSRLYRLDEVDCTEAPTLGTLSSGGMRPPSPSSAAAAAAAASGTARTLIAKMSPIDPQRLIKALTESGVTGGQLAGPDLLAKYLEQEAKQIGLAGRIQMACSAELTPSPLGPLTTSNSALILFPNSSVRILLWESGSHVVCQDEGTRQAIRGAIISCAEMTCIPPYT